LFFATSDFVLSVSIPSFVFIIASVVNRFKILYRHDPFLPWDLSMSAELFGVIGSFGMALLVTAVLGIVFYIIATIIARIFIRTKKINFKLRALGVVLTAALMYLLNSTVYQNPSINQRLYVHGNIFNQVNTSNSRGFIYNFIYMHNTNRLRRPDDFDHQRVVAQRAIFEQANFEALENGVRPHIIMIMGEAFSDIALQPGFDFTGFRHPLENFVRIRDESISGHIVVPSLGGGTGDTEFDVLTGLNTRYLRGVPYSYMLINNYFEALPSILGQIGYRSIAIHPGHEWFYNRQNVFRFFGFERSIFMDEFPEGSHKGPYISDEAATKKIIQTFNDHRTENPDTPLFSFTVTIQNHGPYRDMYMADTNFSTHYDISDDAINVLSNYFYGLADADAQIRDLTDFFENIQEPVVVVYFGDHLPAFTRDVYDVFYPDIHEHGSFEDLSRLFRTPFFIWQNTAARNNLNIDENFANATMPENNIISSPFLGAYLLELLGFNGLSPFMDNVNSLRAEFPVMFETRSFNLNGISSLYLTVEERASLLIYRDWGFYKIFGE